MDKLTQRLQDDAEKIDSSISPELDSRIRTSLHAIAQQPAPAAHSRPISMWWASSITGVAATLAIVAIMNTRQSEPESMTEPVNTPLELPFVDWNAKTAVLTSPLQQEYENLRADIKKAEKVLKDDIGL